MAGDVLPEHPIRLTYGSAAKHSRGEARKLLEALVSRVVGLSDRALIGPVLNISCLALAPSRAGFPP
jgi:hypothetical protein